MKHTFTPERGFTLIETLVAITLLVVAIVAPMTLVSQSLATAFYARDQVAAYNLAQEGIEVVRSVRDANVLELAQVGPRPGLDLLGPIPVNANFTVDARIDDGDITTCSGACPYLRVDAQGQLFGYDPTWTQSKYRRILYATYVGPPGINSGQDEIRITVTVEWTTATGIVRQFKTYSNMYRWLEDSAAN